MTIWAQHWVFHHVPLLWRLHRMHHADLDIDVTTGVRFHPFEILISLAIKIAVIVAFGIPPVGVFVFEVALNATSMFNHSNARMPRWLDRVLRLIVVTPDMHRVHHSIVRTETDSNFGFNLPWWDWLFGTYRREPQAGHDGMTIGIPQFRDPKEQRLDRMLTQPFRNERARSAIRLDVVLLHHRTPELHLVGQELALHVRAAERHGDLHRLDALLDGRARSACRPAPC